MFKELEKINLRPRPFEFYTASDLWTDEYTSKQMLAFHLNEYVDLSSRKKEFIDRSIEWIASYFKIGEETSIADFGCGPGLYTTKLAKYGARVMGIDFSKRSIQYAKEVAAKENLLISYINENYLEFETDDKFDIALMIMCDFCALSPEQRKKLLQKFHAILQPNGYILLDVYSLNAYNKAKEKAIYERNLLDGFWSSDDYYGFLNTFKYDTEKVTLDKYTIIEEFQTKTIYNWLQYFSSKTLEAEFKENGFEVVELYSDIAGNPFDKKADEFAVVAKKVQ